MKVSWLSIPMHLLGAMLQAMRIHVPVIVPENVAVFSKKRARLCCAKSTPYACAVLCSATHCKLHNRIAILHKATL